MRTKGTNKGRTKYFTDILLIASPYCLMPLFFVALILYQPLEIVRLWQHCASFLLLLFFCHAQYAWPHMVQILSLFIFLGFRRSIVKISMVS